MRTRLLLAAGPVFAEHGYARATVREICATAKVNVASVAYYFGDKMGLYRDVIQLARDSRDQQFPVPDGAGQDARDQLYRIIRTMLLRMLSADASGWESQLLMREMQQPTPVFESLVEHAFRPHFVALTGTLRTLIGDAASPHVVEQLALSVVGQCVYYRFGAGVVRILIPASERESHYDIESLSRHITAVTLSATNNGVLLQQRQELEQWLSPADLTPQSSSETQ